MRRLTAIIITSLLLALAAGCGGSSASPVDIVTKAPDATISESTAKVMMSLVVAGPDLPEVTTTGEGAVDFAGKASSMTLDMSDTLRQMGISGDAAKFQMLSTGTTLYMRSPLLDQGAGLAAGKWLKLDLNELTKLQGVDLSQLQQAGNNDPRQGLAFLEGVTEDGVEEIGHEDVRGTGTTHYQANIDLEKAVARSGSVIDADAFKRFVDSLGTKNVQVQVWIDGDNRVRRIRIPMPVPYKADTAKVTITMEYFDFGAPVDVTPPPASDTVDYQDVLGRG
jgi:hypothetical protein